jgi:hypothetical protein
MPSILSNGNIVFEANLSMNFTEEVNESLDRKRDYLIGSCKHLLGKKEKTVRSRTSITLLHGTK